MDEPCPDCGYRYEPARAPELGPRLLADADALAARLEAGDPPVRERPAPDVWSPLAYGCHVRDVLLVQRERLLEARRVDCPQPSPMGRDERVDHDGYDEQEPEAVARQLRDAALLFVNAADRLGPDDWERTLVYNYPEPTERTLRWLLAHTGHELCHHRGDAGA